MSATNLSSLFRRSHYAKTQIERLVAAERDDARWLAAFQATRSQY